MFWNSILLILTFNSSHPVGWGCRICQLHHCRGVRTRFHWAICYLVTKCHVICNAPLPIRINQFIMSIPITHRNKSWSYSSNYSCGKLKGGGCKSTLWRETSLWPVFNFKYWKSEISRGLKSPPWHKYTGLCIPVLTKINVIPLGKFPTEGGTPWWSTGLANKRKKIQLGKYK